MTTIGSPSCLCPPDGDSQLLAKINNNLCILFNLMSSGAFKGLLVNLGACLCSDSVVLATLNNNVVNFLNQYSGGGVVPVDDTIHTWDQLAAVATVGVTVPTIKIWFETATSLYRVTVLQARTDATDTANGIQRPNDYDPATNAKVWYQAGAGA